MRLIQDRKYGAICKHCGGQLALANPKGFCSHIHYPEACDVCSKSETETHNTARTHLATIHAKVGPLDEAELKALSILTDTELNDRIHKAMGHEKCPCAMTDCERWVIDGNPQYWPEYPESLDALKSDPEKMLRAQGWRLNFIWEKVDGWRVGWMDDDGATIHTEALTEERARAEVVCLGLEAGK